MCETENFETCSHRTESRVGLFSTIQSQYKRHYLLYPYTTWRCHWCALCGAHKLCFRYNHLPIFYYSQVPIIWNHFLLIYVSYIHIHTLYLKLMAKPNITNSSGEKVPIHTDFDNTAGNYCTTHATKEENWQQQIYQLLWYPTGWQSVVTYWDNN